MERYRHTVRQLTMTARDGKIQTYSQTINHDSKRWKDTDIQSDN